MIVLGLSVNPVIVFSLAGCLLFATLVAFLASVLSRND